MQVIGHSRLAALCVTAATLFGPVLAVAAEKPVTLTTSALDFKTTLVCSATNVGATPIDVTIDMISPQSSDSLLQAAASLVTLQPGRGDSVVVTLSVGFTSGYCKVTVAGLASAVRAAACAKAEQAGGCQAVSEAR